MPGPLADQPFPVIDLHTHPSLKTWLFGRKFWTAHKPPGGMFPVTMRTDLDALIAGGVGTVLSAIYVVEREIEQDAWPLHYLQHLHPPLFEILNTAPDDVARTQLNHFKKHIDETRRRRGDLVEIAYSYSEMKRIMGEGKLCVINALEGAHHLNGDLANLDDMFDRGVAHMIIPHFYPNAAGGCVDPIPDNLPPRKLRMMNWKRDPDSGLTEFGCELVDRMFDLGIVVDVTHGTPRFRREVYARAKAHPKKRPVIMSHVGVHEFAPYPMNPTPEDIRAIAETGGVIGIIFMTYFLQKPEIRDGEAIVLKTIEHIIEHGGEDAVAFGSDFDGFTGVPRDFKSPRDYNHLRYLLLRNYSEEQVDKFLRGNADRVLREGWGKQ